MCKVLDSMLLCWDGRVVDEVVAFDIAVHLHLVTKTVFTTHYANSFLKHGWLNPCHVCQLYINYINAHFTNQKTFPSKLVRGRRLQQST